MNDLDAVISFAVIMMALSALLQMIDNALSSVFQFRWRTYARLVAKMYGGFFQLSKDDVNALAVYRRDRDESHSVSSFFDRIRVFSEVVVALSRTIDAFCARLAGLQTTLTEVSPGDDPSRLTQDVIAEVRVLRQLMDEVNGYNINQLFTIFHKIHRTKLAPEQDHEPSDRFDERAVRAFIEALDGLLLQASSGISAGFVQELEQQLAAMVPLANQYREQLNGLKHCLVNSGDNVLADLEKQFHNKIAVWNFLIALLLCAGLNADSFKIYQRLSTDPALRASLVENAQGQSQITLGDEKDRLQVIRARLDRLAEQRSGLMGADTEPATGLDVVAGARHVHDDLKNWAWGMEQRARVFNEVLGLKSGDQLVFHRADADAALTESAVAIQEGDPDQALTSARSAYISLSVHFVEFTIKLARAQANFLGESGIPIGWTQNRLEHLDDLDDLKLFKNLCYKVLGIVLTAFLISFGSGFWNGLLEALFGIRGILKNPTSVAKKPS